MNKAAVVGTWLSVAAVVAALITFLPQVGLGLGLFIIEGIIAVDGLLKFYRARFRNEYAKAVCKRLPTMFLVIHFGSAYLIYATFLASSDLLVVSFTSLLLTCAAYLQTSLTDPGGIPDVGWAIDRVRGEDPPCFENMSERNPQGQRRYCYFCSKYKPDRSHHCRACERCILKMDHHCPWVNTCVGFRNYRFFLQMILYASFTFGIVQYDACRTILARLSQQSGVGGVLLVWAALCVFFYGLILIMFSLFHIALVFMNCSTIEFCEKKLKGDWENPYDRGDFTNCMAVFDKSLLAILLPIWPPPSENGTRLGMQACLTPRRQSPPPKWMNLVTDSPVVKQVSDALMNSQASFSEMDERLTTHDELEGEAFQSVLAQ